MREQHPNCHLRALWQRLAATALLCETIGNQIRSGSNSEGKNVRDSQYAQDSCDVLVQLQLSTLNELHHRDGNDELGAAVHRERGIWREVDLSRSASVNTKSATKVQRYVP